MSLCHGLPGKSELKLNSDLSTENKTPISYQYQFSKGGISPLMRRVSAFIFIGSFNTQHAEFSGFFWIFALFCDENL